MKTTNNHHSFGKILLPKNFAENLQFSELFGFYKVADRRLQTGLIGFQMNKILSFKGLPWWSRSQDSEGRRSEWHKALFHSYLSSLQQLGEMHWALDGMKCTISDMLSK